MEPIPCPGALLAPLFNYLPKRTDLTPATVHTDGTQFRQEIFSVLTALQYWTGKYYPPGHEFHTDQRICGAVRDFVVAWAKSRITTAQWEGGLYLAVRAMASRGPSTLANAPADASTEYCEDDPVNADFPTRKIRWSRILMGTGKFALSSGKTHASFGAEEDTAAEDEEEEGDGSSPFLEDVGVDTDRDTEEENMEVTPAEDAMLDE